MDVCCVAVAVFVLAVRDITPFWPRFTYNPVQLVFMSKLYIITFHMFSSPMLDSKYQKKMQKVEKYIRKYGTIDHQTILNEMDTDYDTLMYILSELRNKGCLK